MKFSDLVTLGIFCKHWCLNVTNSVRKIWWHYVENCHHSQLPSRNALCCVSKGGTPLRPIKFFLPNFFFRDRSIWKSWISSIWIHDWLFIRWTRSVLKHSYNIFQIWFVRQRDTCSWKGQLERTERSWKEPVEVGKFELKLESSGGSWKVQLKLESDLWS